MYELYKISNDVNNRIFLGRSGQPDQFENHLKLLNKGQHYNNLLQKDFNNGVTYDYEVLKKSDSPTDIAVSAIERINDGNLLNPLYGYNTFFDKEGLNSRTAKLSLFDEDIIKNYKSFDDQFTRIDVNFEQGNETQIFNAPKWEQ